MEMPKRYKPKRLKKEVKILYGVGDYPNNCYGPFPNLEQALEIVPKLSSYSIFEMKGIVLYSWDMEESEWILIE